MSISVESIIESLEAGIWGLPKTVEMVFFAIIVGMILGCLLAMVRFYRVPVLDKVLAIFVTLYQGIPFVVVLMIYHLLFLSYAGNFLSFFHSGKTVSDLDTSMIGYFALTLMCICLSSEVFRGVLKSIDIGQTEAGYAVGLTKLQTIRRIILPQVVSLAIPSLMNNIVGLIKATSILSVVGITEVTQASLTPSYVSYNFFEGYLAAALIYWAFSALVEFAVGRVENHLGRYRRNA